MNTEHPHRNTPQRKVILDELQKVTSHPTAIDVFALVRRRLPKVSLGTVYRNLELLARLGSIRKLELGGEQARFDATTEPHGHIRCVQCGRVDDFDAPPFDPLGGVADDLDGYQVLGCTIQYFGLCPHCKHCTHNNEKECESC